MIKVWHRRAPTFDEDKGEATRAWMAGGYECVATVTSPPTEWSGHEEEEWAFFRTNSIDKLWTDNDGVAPVRREIRSTSVGDIVERSDGRLMLCAFAGWTEFRPQGEGVPGKQA